MRCLRVQRSHSSIHCLPLSLSLSLHLSLAKCALLRLQKCRFSYTFLLPACYYCQLLCAFPPSLFPTPSLTPAFPTDICVGLLHVILAARKSLSHSCEMQMERLHSNEVLPHHLWSALPLPPSLSGIPLSLSLSLYALYFDSKQWICVQIASSIA